MRPRFANRRAAGRRLAAELSAHAGAPDVVVLGLPRGGVPVAFEVARALRAPLDVFLVRKLGVPGDPELAMGATASGRVRILNAEVVRRLAISAETIDAVTAREEVELARREAGYRGSHAPVELANRTVILVDDGLATGATMRAAVHAIRRQGPRRVIVAAPIAPVATCSELRDEADDVVCVHVLEPFVAVGGWYEDFSQTTEDEVRLLLEQADRELRHHVASSTARRP